LKEVVVTRAMRESEDVVMVGTVVGKRRR